MKTKHVFWGLLFITLGILILLNNFGSLNYEWGELWKLWPLVLILWGISILIKVEFLQVISSALAGIVFALVIFSAFHSFFGIFNGNLVIDSNDDIEFSSDARYDTTNYILAYGDSIKSAYFNFDGGAGKFIIEDTTSKLLKATTYGIKDNYNFMNSYENGKTDISMKMKKTRFSFGKKYRNKTVMLLNPNTIWNLNFELGAAKSDFDLSKMKVSSLKIDIGAASVYLKISDLQDSSNIKIDGAASSIKIEVPENSGCEIKSEVSLSSKSFYGFNKINSDLYRTGNFNEAKNKIYIKIEADVSSIKVDRY